MKSPIADEQRLEHIWHCLARIQEVVKTTSRDNLPSNESAQESLFYNLMILGEACNRLTPEFRSSHPDIPWPKIVGLRNVLIHDYSNVDFDIAWQVVTKDINALAAQFEPICTALPKADSLPEGIDLL